MQPRGLLSSAAMFGIATVLAKLVAFGKDWMLARRFGASDELDAYWVAFVVLSFAVAVVNNALSSAFLPTLVRTAQHEGQAAARRLVGETFGLALLVLTALTALLLVTAHYLLASVGRGFDPEKLALTASLFRIVLGILIISGISSIAASVLNAYERFTITAWAPIAIPIVMLVVFGVFQDEYGIYALAWGTFLGFVLECAVLLAGLFALDMWSWPAFFGWTERLWHVARQALHAAAGAALMSSNTLVDQSMAASYGSGGVSILNFSNKIVALVLSILALSLINVLFPRFSQLIASGSWAQLRQLLSTTTRWVFLATVPMIFVLAVLSEPLVRILFERGAFTHETTLAVSRVQLWYLPQIPFYVLAFLGGRLLAALDANHLVLRIAALNLVMNVVGNLFFMHFFGVTGIAMSTSLMYTVAWLVTQVAIRSQLAVVPETK